MKTMEPIGFVVSLQPYALTRSSQPGLALGLCLYFCLVFVFVFVLGFVWLCLCLGFGIGLSVCLCLCLGLSLCLSLSLSLSLCFFSVARHVGVPPFRKTKDLCLPLFFFSGRETRWGRRQHRSTYKAQYIKHQTKKAST